MEKLLLTLRLTQYIELFKRNGIDDMNMQFLSHEDLKDMGISIVGHRLKIIQAIHTIPLTPTGNVKYRINQLKTDLIPLFAIANDLQQFLHQK